MLELSSDEMPAFVLLNFAKASPRGWASGSVSMLLLLCLPVLRGEGPRAVESPQVKKGSSEKGYFVKRAESLRWDQTSAAKEHSLSKSSLDATDNGPFMFAPAFVRLKKASPIVLAESRVDSNSPAHWDGTDFYVFTSWFEPSLAVYRSQGSNVLSLGPASAVRFEGQRSWSGGLWLEATYQDDDGTLYGWYHNEPGGVCPDNALTAPRIGAMRSEDNGASWTDLGIVLEAAPRTLNCEAMNGFFAGGHGDFSVLFDRETRHFYFFFGNYGGDTAEQGVAMARMRYEARDNPVGNVWKWYQGDWTEPGLGGQSTPIFPASRSWVHSDPDSFWGPTVHFNRHIQMYVMLLNRTQNGNGDWRQEGVYLALAKTPSTPDSWTLPRRIFEGGDWYPQVIGMDFAARDTDKLAARVARFFLRGISLWEISFHIRPQIRAAGSGCSDQYCVWLVGKNFGEGAHVDVRRNDGSDDIIATYSGPDLFRESYGEDEVITFSLAETSQRTLFAAQGLRFWVVNPMEETWSEGVTVRR